MKLRAQIPLEFTIRFTVNGGSKTNEQTMVYIKINAQGSQPHKGNKGGHGSAGSEILEYSGDLERRGIHLN